MTNTSLLLNILEDGAKSAHLFMEVESAVISTLYKTDLYSIDLMLLLLTLHVHG